MLVCKPAQTTLIYTLLWMLHACVDMHLQVATVKCLHMCSFATPAGAQCVHDAKLDHVVLLQILCPLHCQRSGNLGCQPLTEQASTMHRIGTDLMATLMRVINVDL